MSTAANAKELTTGWPPMSELMVITRLNCTGCGKDCGTYEYGMEMTEVYIWCPACARSQLP